MKTDNIQSEVYQGSGEYQIIGHAKADNVDGYITALGAKYTTGRRLSALTLNIIAKKLGTKNVAVGKLKSHDSDYLSLKEFKKNKLSQYKDKYSETLILHLINNYGSNIDDFIASLTPDLMQPICHSQPDILGQVQWAVIHEQAMQLNDVLFGRTSVGLLGITNDEIIRIANLMAKLLNWNDRDKEQQISQAINEQQYTRNCLNGV